MTKEEVLEKMEEEKESVKSKVLYGQSSNSSANGCGWCFDVINHAIDLVEQLDEPKKVVIPQFVADWIEEAAQPSNLATISVMHSDAIKYGKHIDWFRNHDNQRLLLKALLYGYEIEKQKKYRVKIDSKLYFQRFENIEAVFVIDDSLGVKESSPVFTREVGNKILETLGVESGQLEEVEDD